MAPFGSKSEPSIAKRFFGLFETEQEDRKLKEVRKAFQQRTNEVAKEDYDWWDGLPYEERLRAFRCVCRRIQQGDVVERGSYRHVLYSVFGFDADAYVDGMDCGYMDIHNLIFKGLSEGGRQEST